MHVLDNSIAGFRDAGCSVLRTASLPPYVITAFPRFDPVFRLVMVLPCECAIRHGVSTRERMVHGHPWMHYSITASRSLGGTGGLEDAHQPPPPFSSALVV